MPGYFLLDNENFEALFQGNELSVEHVPPTEHLTNPYVFEKHGELIIVRSPVNVGSLAEVLLDIQNRMDMSNKHLLLGVVGQGATEQHIVTLHIPPAGTKPIIYDSKSSNPERFFSDNPSRNTFGGLLGSILQTLNPFAAKRRTVDLSHLGIERLNNADYYALGTQSFFDGVTCGYHTGNNIKALAKLLEQDTKPTVSLLLAKSNNPVGTSAQLLNEVTPNTVKMSFFAFLKKAWQDAFLPLVNEKERDKYHFGHYFMGWPSSQKKGSIVAYFITVKFISSPLFNLLTLATELPFNILSETFSFLKNKLLSWAATNPVTQGIRSLLLLPIIGIQGAFKGISYLLRIVSSPLVSFKEAKKIHPALGYLSALASVIFIGAGIGALAVFVPPAIAANAFAIGGHAAIATLQIAALPFIKLFAVLDLSISTPLAATLTFISLGLILSTLHLIGRKVIYPKVTAANEISSMPEAGSNANSFLPRPDNDPDLAEDFAPTDIPPAAETSMLRSSFGRRKPGEKENTPEEGFHLEGTQDTIAPGSPL